MRQNLWNWPSFQDSLQEEVLVEGLAGFDRLDEQALLGIFPRALERITRHTAGDRLGMERRIACPRRLRGLRCGHASCCKFPSSAILPSTTNRLGLTFPSAAKAELLTVAYLTYYGVKMSHGKEILDAKRSGDLSPVRDIAFKLAKFYYPEHHRKVKRPGNPQTR